MRVHLPRCPVPNADKLLCPCDFCKRSKGQPNALCLTGFSHFECINSVGHKQPVKVWDGETSSPEKLLQFLSTGYHEMTCDSSSLPMYACGKRVPAATGDIYFSHANMIKPYQAPKYPFLVPAKTYMHTNMNKLSSQKYPCYCQCIQYLKSIFF